MKNFIQILEKIWMWLMGGVIVLGAVYYFVATQNPPGANLTVYPVQCDNSATSINNCTNPQKLDRIAYKVDTNNREVVYWDPDITTGNINYSNDKNCSIADMDNWSCTSGGATYGFSSGKYFDNRNPYIIFISAVNWTSMQKYKTSAYVPPTTLLQSDDVTSKVQITCYVGNKQTISGTDSGIRFSQSDFDSNGNFIGHDKNVAIQADCGISQAEAMAEFSKFANGDKSAILFNVLLTN